jgi:tetratricopeptide (TPR) repeat protein
MRSQGQGHYFETPEDAEREARKRLAAGDALIDVGCLQVDLYHHPDAFRTVADAFDPRENADYAAGYLARLAREHGSWLEAVAAYNAGRPADGVDYLARVLYLWRGVKLTASAAGAHGFALEEMPAPLDAAARFYAAKDYPAALEIYADLLRHHPDDPAALAGSGETLLAQGHFDAARERFQDALLRTRGDDPAALSGLLKAIAALPPDRALTALIAARTTAPAAPEIPTRLALLLADAGRLDEAAQAMGEAARLAPGDPMRRLDYALLLDRAGQVGPAAHAYAEFLALYRPDAADPAVPIERIRQRYAYLSARAP